MREKYTAAAIKAELVGSGRHFYVSHDCSICRESVGWLYSEEDDRLFYSSACGCSRSSRLRDTEWQEMANALDMQSSDQIRDDMLADWKGEKSPNSGGGE